MKKIKRVMMPMLLFTLFVSAHNFAAVRLPVVFTDNMVVQRDKPLKVWGWADKGEAVTVSFNRQLVKAKADARGYWQVTLKPMLYGGPYEMTVTGKADSHTLKNVLIGDVWICSGQSNMEMPIEGFGKPVINAAEEIKTAQRPAIRLFTVEKATSYTPVADLKGGSWKECTPENVPSFSAVAYFFGRKLNEELNIPIGLINTSWGGTNIQTWISWDRMGQQEQYKNIRPQDLPQMEASRKKKATDYQAALANDPGTVEKWQMPQTPIADWKKIMMPVTFEKSEIGHADGIVWFRRGFMLTEAQASSDVTINFGAIDDADETYINGVLVGKTNNWNANRSYTIPRGALHTGSNIIVVKVLDTGGDGGFTGVAKDMFITAGPDQLPLRGEWLYKPSATTLMYNVQDTGPNSFPSQLYNAMVAPIISYAAKGVIWYQGEANTGEAYKYRTLLPELINDWRAKWNDELPFFWVQLANFMQPAAVPQESSWAELREAQHMTLKVAKTGEAVIIDTGEADDIHPRNKQDVGYRLALAALKVTYNKDVVCMGPEYKSMQVSNGKAILTFSNPINGLVAKGDKYGYLKGFAIAGSDHRFVWAKAYIDGDQVVVYSDQVKEPVAVRYAWGDNPDDANLFNRAGLPASPFRTDTWKGITEK